MGLKIRLGYAQRLFASLVLYSVILVGCFAVFQYHRERDFKAEELDLRLQMVNERILDELADTIPADFAPVALPHTFSDLRISVIRPDGRVVYDNSLDTLPGSSHLDRSEIAAALRHGHGYTVRRHSESTGQNYFYSATHSGDFVVRTAVPYSVTLANILSADFGFIWFLLALTAVMCVIGFWATHRLGSHIRRLNRFAWEAERGEKIADTDPFPHDELGEISNHIVRLYARLQQAIADRDREHRAALHQEQEKIRIKRSLTDNINHELKTPVASMQVCLETLAEHPDMDADKRTEFVGRCLKANERLRLLLADVAAITRLEDGSASIAVEPVDVAVIAAEVCEEYEPQAAAKGIRIVNTVTCRGLQQGNASLVASVYRNLLANAIAYSGGTEIVVGERAGDGAGRVFTVADNGTGVAPEHLPHLFERFYRVDKGRSRRAGGTGLGLSIVKNAVLWHGGSVSVENRRTGGLLISFTLGGKN